MDAKVIAGIRRKYKLLAPELHERSRRQWAATEARELGYGGVSAVAKTTGLSRPTIVVGLKELELPKRQREIESVRIRREGGGRTAVTENDPEMLAALDALIDPVTRGDPESPLRWTRQFSAELTSQGHAVSNRTVADVLREAGYSLQANCKTRESRSQPDRNAQFEFINSSVHRFLDRGQPAISVDTKKKELVGDFKNADREWHPKGEPNDLHRYALIAILAGSS